MLFFSNWKKATATTVFLQCINRGDLVFVPLYTPWFVVTHRKMFTGRDLSLDICMLNTDFRDMMKLWKIDIYFILKAAETCWLYWSMRHNSVPPLCCCYNGEYVCTVVLWKWLSLTISSELSTFGHNESHTKEDRVIPKSCLPGLKTPEIKCHLVIVWL